ncbi:hypothetical protein B0H19DRAFT_1088384 [Mycena capillaripes]|nr:hypothetical protein B0H19DRAFT_1088384 [Mycena capillaripes]
MSNRREVTSRLSLYTESTVPSTVWGPGTVAGRAILALGEATLKGLDRIYDREGRAIQRRLAIIRSTLPRNVTPDMYTDLIELSRPDVYPEFALRMAIDLLLRQFEHGCYATVALGLIRLPSSEAQLVVCKLFALREPQILNEWFEIRRHHKHDRHLPPDPALGFLALLIQLRPEMTSTCCQVIDNLSRDTDIWLLFLSRNDPILRIYAEDSLEIPAICRTPLSQLQMTSSGDPMHRWKNWKSLEAAGHSTESRLLDLSTVLLNAVSDNWYCDPAFFDAAVDLFDLLRYSKIPGLRRMATDQLIACITVRHSWEPFRIVLDFVSRRPGGQAGRSKYLEPSLSTILGYGSYIANITAIRAEMNSLPIPGFEFHPMLCEFLRYAHLRTYTAAADLEPTKSANVVPDTTLSTSSHYSLGPDSSLETIFELDETATSDAETI